MSRCVVRSGVTYSILVTLLTSQLPMFWLKADAQPNMYLYADKQHTE